MNLRASYTEDTQRKTTRFVNGLRLEILDKISIISPKTIEEAYQSALNVEKISQENIILGEDEE